MCFVKEQKLFNGSRSLSMCQISSMLVLNKWDKELSHSLGTRSKIMVTLTHI